MGKGSRVDSEGGAGRRVSLVYFGVSRRSLDAYPTAKCKALGSEMLGENKKAQEAKESCNYLHHKFAGRCE